MSRSRPLLRAALYPYLDSWVGGPGLSVPVIRFGLWAGWLLSEHADAPPGIDVAIHFALLAPEIPYSVLPFSFWEKTRIRVEPVPEAPGAARPVPRWRGLPCRFGRSRIRLSSQDEDNRIELPILVLFPDQDPPGPRPEVAYLGAEFLVHYSMDVVLRYSSLQYTDPGETAASSTIDRTSPAGYLEIG
jgi:hypothetical protein